MKVPTADICSLVPLAIEALPGMTAIETRFEKSTFTVAVALWKPKIAFTMLEPLVSPKNS